MGKFFRNIEDPDAVLDVLNAEDEEQTDEGFAQAGKKKGLSKRERVILEKGVSGGVHAAMLAAILIAAVWDLEVPVLIGLGIYHTGACAVAWDRARALRNI